MAPVWREITTTAASDGSDKLSAAKQLPFKIRIRLKQAVQAWKAKKNLAKMAAKAKKNPLHDDLAEEPMEKGYA